MKRQHFTFKHLDINNLKTIAGRWAADYTEEGARVHTISIHPILLPIPWAEVLPGQKGPKYAVVFHCPDCTRDDLPSNDEPEEEFFQKAIENRFSPYTDLWCDLRNKSKHLFYRGLFESVYRDTPPDNWISEWRFVLKYLGKKTPLDVMEDSGVVLFQENKGTGQGGDSLEKVMEYLMATDQEKIKTNDVIQLLENKNIRFDFPNMSKEEQRENVQDLLERGLNKRMVALILDWQRIKSKQVQLKSTERTIARIKNT
jgi:hypothetical protein